MATETVAAGKLRLDDPGRGPLILDVTLRDGGYVNGHRWTLDEAASIARVVDAVGIPYVEVGYLRTPDGDPLRPSSHCPGDYLENLAARVNRTRLVVMVRPQDTAPDRVGALRDHGVTMVRILVPGLDVEAAGPHLRAARAAGLVVAANLTHVGGATPEALGKVAADCADAGADVVYLADSNGSLYPDDVRARVEAAVHACRVPVGFHPHDNLGLAFINTCVAVDAGAVVVDASIAGMGKGGGNLRLELIAAHCVRNRGADYRLDPLIRDRGADGGDLPMLAGGSSDFLIAGLLDIGFDRTRQLREQAARHGYDRLLRGGFEAGPEDVPAH